MTQQLTIEIEDGDAGTMIAALLGYRMQIQSLGPGTYQIIAKMFGDITAQVLGERQVMPSQEVMIHRLDALSEKIMKASKGE